ncbi:MAG: hypothetical protein QM680_04395 [Luteolibacter sp.]
MHRFPYSSQILRFRLSALLVWLIAICVPAATGVLIYSLLIGDQKLTWISIGLISIAAFATVWQWVLSNRAKCPLCLMPSISHKSCSRHRSAKRLFGSFRLQVATSILFQNSFRCPYCGEQSALELRHSHNHGKNIAARM